MIENIKDYKYVDLGLPSGTLWCDRNIGATSIYDTGQYFQWADTTEGTTVSTNESTKDKFNLNKTQYNNIFGARLNRDIVPGGEFDTATKHLGSKWRMPTELQFKELFSNTTQEFDSNNNVLKLTSKKNDKVIYLPAGGYIRSSEEDGQGNPIADEDGKYSYLISKNTAGSYWSTYINYAKLNCASNLFFSYSKDEQNNDVIKFDFDSIKEDYRWTATNIRPVYYRSQIVSNEISTDEKNIQKPIGNLYEYFLDNKNFSINKINTIYDDKTPSDSINNANDINNIILGRLMKTNDNYESNVTACSNSLIFYKYKYNQESNKYYTGINLYYCDNYGLCFPVVQNMYVEESNSGSEGSTDSGSDNGSGSGGGSEGNTDSGSGSDSDSGGSEEPQVEVLEGAKILCKYNVTSTSNATQLYNSSYDSSNFVSMKIDTSEEEISPTSSYTFTTNTEDNNEHTVEFTLANGVKSIGTETFFNCSSLTSITIPNSITSIDDKVFRDCSRLTNVIIPDSVTSIGEYAFQGCYSLTSINIPDSVTSIGEYAFQGCYSITNVTIGNSVKSIGKCAFYYCSRLTSIICNAMNAPKITDNTFQDINSVGTLTIHTGATGYDEWPTKLGSNWTKVEQ